LITLATLLLRSSAAAGQRCGHGRVAGV